MADDEDLLDILLSKAVEEIDEPPKNKESKKVLKDVDIFSNDESELTGKSKLLYKSSTVHSGDTDSSDDEDNRNHEERKYNICGKELKRLLSNTQSHSSSSKPIKQFDHHIALGQWKTNAVKSAKNANAFENSAKKQPTKEKFDVFTDPIFGLRITNPLISSAVLKERMIGRDPVQFFQISKYLQTRKSDKDWVLAGVIANSSAVRTSQKGNKYLIWTFTDLKDDIKTVSVFLFGNAYNQLWKTEVGTVLGILNPTVLDKKDGSKDVASLSIDNSQKVMIFGTSKDLGTCKSVKKNGEKCTAIVNINRCEFCLYHVKQEYQKCSQRSDLQSNFAGRGLVALRNKVLGKNEVFYAGKSYMAIPAKKSRKLEQRDNKRLDSLSGLNAYSSNIVKAKKKIKKKENAPRLDVSLAQRKKDFELLKKLGGTANIDNKINFAGNHSTDVTLEESKNTALSVISKLKMKNSKPVLDNKAKYDIQNDLIINIESKNSFGGKTSEEVTLEKSKSSATGIIAKLKENNKTSANTETKCEDIEYEETSNDNDFHDDLNLNYDDIEELEKENSRVDSTADNNKTPEIDISLKIEEFIASTNGLPPKIRSARIISSDQIVNSKMKYIKDGSSISLKNKETANQRQDVTTDKNCSNVSQTKSPIVILSNRDTTYNSVSSKMGDISLTKSHLAENSTFCQIKDNTNYSLSMTVPSLSRFGAANGFIDLNEPLTKKPINRAKLEAIKFVQANGPIKKNDPNSTRSSSNSSSNSSGKKRFMQETQAEDRNPKKSKLVEDGLISDRFRKMMALTSRHADLLEDRDDEEQEKYFQKQEMKERMEEKMANTFKIACKAVRCLKCKYTSFSASELCKKERHPFKVFDAMKRFFKCGHCQNRTVTLAIVPMEPCKNCGSGKWEKTSMMKEKIVEVKPQLSIRGGEQTFLNSVITDANINLLVPEES